MFPRSAIILQQSATVRPDNCALLYYAVVLRGGSLKITRSTYTTRRPDFTSSYPNKHSKHVRFHRVKPYGTAFYFILKYCVDGPMMVVHDRNKGLFPNKFLFDGIVNVLFFNFRWILRLLVVYINYINKVRLNTRIFIRQILVRSFTSFLRRWQSFEHWLKE
jgi:hypothetical protein